MINKVRETLHKYSMLKAGVRVLLCVSGGPDSMAMLSAFNYLRKGMRLKLFVAHLNHKLRGDESDIDEEYVKAKASALKIPVISRGEDVKKYAVSNKLSLEDAARRARYNFFLKAARDLNIDAIATAHTRDDQAETVLMRLIRGTGLRGLRGISPKRNIAGYTLIRPLIAVSRKDIEEYLKSRKVTPRLDTSNLEVKFLRNKIRLKLLPLLEKDYSPNIKELLFNLTDVLNTDYDYIDIQKERVFKRIATLTKDGAVKFSLAAFKKEHTSIKRALVRKAIELLKGSLDKIDYRHSKEIENLVYKRPYGCVVHLPGGVRAAKRRSSLLFYCPHRIRDKKDNSKIVGLNIPGETRLGRKIIRAKILSHGTEILSRLRQACGEAKRHGSKEYFDLGKVSFPLISRLRRPGDAMMPLGMKRHKKISDILIDEKVPRARRDNIPIIVSGDGKILWLCGVRISEEYKVSKNTKNILRLELLRR